MRVTFPRLADHQRGGALVERRDGVTYWLDGGPVTAELPHDLVHFTVERTLGIADGIWGAIAGGVVFHSMHHRAGRRPPHAAERSAALIKANRDRLQRAELLGGFVERISHVPRATAADIASFAKAYLATLPEGDVDLRSVADAATGLRATGDRWRALSVGDELTVEWPDRLRLPSVPLPRPRRATNRVRVSR
jgi:hypothetical protein